MIKALALHNDHSGCDYHRIALPFRYGGEYVDNAAFYAARGDMDKLFSAAEVIVWNRLFPFGWASEVKNEHSVKTIVDLDDYWELYPHHYLNQTYKQQRIPDKIIKTLQSADAVTVTTFRLADKVRPYNKNVYVIPNALPFGEGQFMPKRKESDVFRILYPGQRSHMYDARILKGPLQRLASDNNREVGVMLAGYSPEDKSGIWADMNRTISAGGKMKNYQTIGQLPLDEYMTIYDHADAVLVPLENNTFNHHKSNLKLLEAATRRLPVICQKVAPYSDCDAPVLWVEKQSDWYQHMKYLVKNRSAGVELGERLYEWANTHHNLFVQNRYRFDLYRHIINS